MENGNGTNAKDLPCYDESEISERFQLPKSNLFGFSFRWLEYCRRIRARFAQGICSISHDRQRVMRGSAVSIVFRSRHRIFGARKFRHPYGVCNSSGTDNWRASSIYYQERLFERMTQARLRITRYSLRATHYPLLVTRYPLPVTHYALLITRYSLPVTHYDIS